MGSRRPKILVVDDDAAIRTMLGLALTDAGYAVTEATGGLKALDLIVRRRFDRIILDINMPDVNGYDVLARIGEMPARRGTPVFIVSANGHEPSGVIREISGGAVGRLTKPFNMAELEHAVAEALAEPSAKRENRQIVNLRAAQVYQSLQDLRLAGGEDDEPVVDRRRLIRSR
jgi:DNA-binding response OmpR family regulator